MSADQGCQLLVTCAGAALQLEHYASRSWIPHGSLYVVFLAYVQHGWFHATAWIKTMMNCCGHEMFGDYISTRWAPLVQSSLTSGLAMGIISFPKSAITLGNPCYKQTQLTRGPFLVICAEEASPAPLKYRGHQVMGLFWVVGAPLDI